MALVNEGGALRVVGGALGTGQACCCNKCSGPCDENNPCPEGCTCVDGQCQESPCSGPCECAEQDFACSVIFFDTEEEANQFCQDPARVFRNCDIYDPEVNPLPDQGERWGVDYCECTAPSVCPEGCVCVNGECVEQDCATQGCPPAQIEGNTLTRQCCGKFHFNPALPQEEQFQSGECFPGYFALSFCIPSECSIEQYLNFEAGCEITAGIYFGDTCPDGCPEGSKCITVNSCPGA